MLLRRIENGDVLINQKYLSIIPKKKNRILSVCIINYILSRSTFKNHKL